jgi:hypothetical protein
VTEKRGDDFVEEAEERLEELGDDIAKARERSTEAVHGSFYDEPDDRFVESGDEPESKAADDQTIAPPG